MHKVIISGGPSTGKSTTFNALHNLYPEAHFVEEAAEQVIKGELAQQAADPTYEPVMPVANYARFAPLVLARQIENERSIPSESKLAFLDRSIIDNLGYLAHNGISDFAAEVQSHISSANYSLVFFCDWLAKFEQTEVRRESAEEGLSIHGHLEDVYESSGLLVVHLPAVSVDERLTIIRETIDSLSADQTPV